MSTAVMPTPIYEFDSLFKNQTNARQHQQLQQSSNVSNTNNNNSTVSLTSQLNNNSLQNSQTATAAAIALQQQLNATVAAQQAQVNQQHQQHQQKLMLHNALQRAVSQPHGGAVTNVVSLMNTLIENLGHRKLERTQSEPLPQVNTSRYKTELCRPFEEAGECKYGDKCQFAHGMHELRNLQRHPKYKTELCRTFHSVGFCPYGPRCHFVHNAEEARAHNRAVNAAYARMAAAAAAQGHGNGNYIPMSPPLSMSTGSDRASPTGSLSLSPTNSMASFFPEQNSPTFPQGFAYPQSPPSSPRGLSPVTTPPPQSTSSMSTSSSASSTHHQNHHHSNNNNNHQNHHHHSSSSVSSSTDSSSTTSQDDARLPVFNRLSSTIDAFTNMAI